MQVASILIAHTFTKNNTCQSPCTWMLYKESSRYSQSDTQVAGAQSCYCLSSGCWLTVSCMACYAGRAQDQLLDMRCHSTQDQEASVQQKGPNISRLAPALQQQWDHAANSNLGLIDIKPYSNRKVWWICDQCPDGHLHSWEASVANRSNGSGCCQCAGRTVCKHNSLATKAPKVAAQWDYEANAGTPDNVVAHSSQAVGWVCEVCGKTWSATPNKRVTKKSNTGCPQCYKNRRSKNQIKHPTFAECQDPRGKAVLAEWDHERNAANKNFPHNTCLYSNKQIWWLCNKCPAGQQHSWSARPCDRSGKHKSGCPFCAGMAACRCNSLQALHPAIGTEWDHSKKQSQPSDHTDGSMMWLGGSALSMVAGNSPLTHARRLFKCL